MTRGDEYETPRGMAQEPNWVLGSELSERTKREALACFVNRYTADHLPPWRLTANKAAFPSGVYPVQYASDAEWLSLTHFAVTKSGRLDKRVKRCESGRPTWPNNPELRKD